MLKIGKYRAATGGIVRVVWVGERTALGFYGDDETAPCQWNKETGVIQPDHPYNITAYECGVSYPDPLFD